jgi:hypothetical protein
MNISIDTILTLLFVLYVIISFVSGAGRQVREAQRRAQENTAERELRELEARQKREANPDTQSYQSYLERTRQEKLGGDSVPDTLGHSRQRPHFDLPPGAGRDGNDRETFAGDLARAGGMSEQERLRQEMARKMGRGAPPPTPPSHRQPQSLEDILREFTQTIEGRQRPAQTTQQSTPQTTGRAPSKPARPTPRPPARPETNPIVPTLRAEMTANVSAAASEGQASVASVREPPAVRGTQTTGTLRTPTRGLGTLGKEDLLRTIVWTEILQPPRSRRR